MKTFNCLIVDDNEIERDAIVMYLRRIPSLSIVAICSDGTEAANFIVENQIDIVFSDINMPGISGISLLKSLKNPPEFIFITSFSEYAAESFNLDAIDFVVKPANFERLLKAVNKTIEYLNLKKWAAENHQEDATPTLAKAQLQPESDFFFFKETKGITKLKYNDLIYIESMGDFSKLHTANSQHVVLASLKSFEQQLPIESFLRIHRQYIVNSNRITTITNHEVHLDNDHAIPISLLYRQELLTKVVNKKTISRFYS